MKVLSVPFRWFKRRSRFQKILILLVLLSLGGLVVWSNQKDYDQSAYTTELPTRGSITEIISETGNVTAVGVTPIYSTVTGIVDQVFVTNGTQVEKNTPLFTVISTASSYEKASAWAAYQAALSALKNAENSRLSAQASLDKVIDDIHLYQYGNGGFGNVGSANETQTQKTLREQSEATLRSAVNTETSARAQFLSAQLAYQSTQDGTIRALVGGEVQNLGIAPGDMVVVQNQTAGTMPPALVMVDNNVQTFIKISVNEADAIKVQTGQAATVEFDAIDGEIFSAIVDRVDTIASVSQGVIQFAVYVQLTESSDLIQRGMSADVDITVASKDNVLSVVSSAIKPYQGGKAVRVLDEMNEIKFIPVEVGIRGDGRTEIVSGIDETTPVIVVSPSDAQRRSGGLF